jgi:hypothetical protein
VSNLDEHEVESALAAVDALAANSIAWAAPIRYDVARTPAELEAVYRLRYSVAIEHGWATPADLPRGLEQDIYDDRAAHVVGWKNRQPIAVARLVFPNARLRLPTEEAFNLDIEPRGQVVDVNRVTVIAAYSDPRHQILAGLLGRAWLEIRAQGYFRVCAYAALPLLRLYRLMGLQFTRLGPSQLAWGEVRSPICFDIPASATLLLQRLGRSTG